MAKKGQVVLWGEKGVTRNLDYVCVKSGAVLLSVNLPIDSTHREILSALDAARDFVAESKRLPA